MLEKPAKFRFYSVPTDYIKDQVKVRDDGLSVRIYTQDNVLIATHRKALTEWQKVTDPEHEPEHYGDHDGYSPEYFRSWAGHYGPNTTAWVDMMLDHWQMIVHAFRPLYTGLMAAKGCDRDVVESACAVAVHTRTFATKGLKALIEREKAKKEASLLPTPEVDLNSLYFTHDYEKEETR